MTSHSKGTDAYRLIVTRRSAAEILLWSTDAGWALPLVEIPKQQRPAEHLTAAAKQSLGLASYCLLVSRLAPRSQSEQTLTAVLECVNVNEKAPTEACWMPVNIAADCCATEEAAPLRTALAELSAYASGAKHGPFAKSGWLKELFCWAHEQTAPLGLRLTGKFRQLNASPTFSLVWIETDDFALWFKATGEPNAHELPITALLADLFPHYVPRILGVHRSWNGWLSAETEGAPLDELTECAAWERAARALAELQIASIGKDQKLLDGGCREMGLTEAAKLIAPFLRRMGGFMRTQEKLYPAPLEASELLSLGEALEDLFSLLLNLGLPDTLGHLDCNPGNLIVSSDRCIFLDWAEACVTSPVVTFEYLRRQMERCGIAEPAADSRITAAYLRPWAAFYSEDVLRQAIALVPAVAVFLHAVSGSSWRTLDPVANPALAGYFRSLTRRMYRDAVLAAERSERCLS